MKRIKEILGKRDILSERVEQVKRMRQWVIDAENILNSSWVEIPEGSHENREALQKKLSSNTAVALRFDQFLMNLKQKHEGDEMSQTEKKCLGEFLRVFSNLRPYLIQCYDLDVFPRTNNEMEGSIRKIKTRYRRITGRKNWNAYLLRYGRYIAFYSWWEESPERWAKFENFAQKIDRDSWKEMKKETRSSRSEQLKRYRFLHSREKFLTTLEERWASVSETDFLH